MRPSCFGLLGLTLISMSDPSARTNLRSRKRHSLKPPSKELGNIGLAQPHCGGCLCLSEALSLDHLGNKNYEVGFHVVLFGKVEPQIGKNVPAALCDSCFLRHLSTS